MAQAIECDKCKKLIKQTNPDQKVQAGGEYIVCIRVYRDWTREGRGLDICDECIDELLENYLNQKSGKVIGTPTDRYTYRIEPYMKNQKHVCIFVICPHKGSIMNIIYNLAKTWWLPQTVFIKGVKIGKYFLMVYKMNEKT